MTIRDRGKLKWQSAFFMPEHVSMIRKLDKEELKQGKPLIDEYQIEEFEQKIKLAIEYKYQVKITKWEAGYFVEYIGSLSKIEPLTKTLLLVMVSEEIQRIKFEEVVGMEIIEN